MIKYLLPCNENLLIKSYEILLNQVGTKELTGKNDGDVEKYLKALGLPKGSAYCLAGQVYCFLEAAKILNQKVIPLPKTGLVKNLVLFADRHGIKTELKPEIHDIICWRVPDSIKGHAERIIEIHKDYVLTVGFNTSNGLSGSQREGDGVFKRKRNFKPFSNGMYVKCLIGFETRD